MASSYWPLSCILKRSIAFPPMLSYRLVCVSLDGDKVTEGHFSNVKEAQERSEQMGSRWYFYPIQVVTGRVKIIDLPDVVETEKGILDLKGFKGRNLSILLSFLKEFYRDQVLTRPV